MVYSYEELLEQLQKERGKTEKLKAKVKALEGKPGHETNGDSSSSESDAGECSEQKEEENKGKTVNNNVFFSNRLDIDERGQSIFRDDDMQLGSSFDGDPDSHTQGGDKRDTKGKGKHQKIEVNKRRSGSFLSTTDEDLYMDVVTVEADWAQLVEDRGVGECSIYNI